MEILGHPHLTRKGWGEGWVRQDSKALTAGPAQWELHQRWQLTLWLQLLPRHWQTGPGYRWETGDQGRGAGPQSPSQWQILNVTGERGNANTDLLYFQAELSGLRERAAPRTDLDQSEITCLQMPNSSEVAWDTLPITTYRDSTKPSITYLPIAQSHVTQQLILVFYCVWDIILCLQRGPLLIKFENKCSRSIPPWLLEDGAEPSQVSCASQRHFLVFRETPCLWDAP